MIKKISALFFLLVIVLNSIAQKAKDEKKEDFNIAEAEACLIKSLNKVRLDNNLDSLENQTVLYKAAEKKVGMMLKAAKAELKDPKETQKRVIAFGGTNKTQELVVAYSAMSNRKALTAQEFADAIIHKWRTGKLQQSIIKNPDYKYASPCVRLDEKNKAYVSIVFGSYATFNTGAKKQKELEVPYTTSNKKLKAPDDRVCNNCKKFTEYDALAAGVYVEKGIIYIRYH